MIALPLAAVEVSGGYVLGAILVWVIGNLVTWIIAARVTGAAQAEQIRAVAAGLARLDDVLATLSARLEALGGRIEAVAEARSACALDASRTYATRQELVRTLTETGKLSEAVGRQVEGIHDRITRLGAQVSELIGRRAAEGPQT